MKPQSQFRISSACIAILLLAVLSACDQQPASSSNKKIPQSTPSTAADKKAAPLSSPLGAYTSSLRSQSFKPTIDLTKTRTLLDRMTDRDLGERAGRIESHTDGILIQPGASPTSATFSLGGKYGKETLAAWILFLSPERASNPSGGTVAFEIRVDGESVGRWQIDRSTNQEVDLDLSGAQTMELIVDNANGAADWDLSVFGLK